MTSQRWMLVLCFSLASVLGTVESVTMESQKYTCRTFGSGVMQPFNGSSYYIRSNCPFTLTRFTHNRVLCDITIRRGDNGLLERVEIIINKVRTILQDGVILVEMKRVSLPYDHTYQHIFRYGVYTRLKSSLLPLTVTWHNVPGGIDTLWVEVELSVDMTGLCGKYNMSGNQQQLTQESVLDEDTCQTRDPIAEKSSVCNNFISEAYDCLFPQVAHYIQLCEENIYSYETSKYIGCAFFREVVLQCGDQSYVWDTWRTKTNCGDEECPGDLIYMEKGPAYVPSCSNPTVSNQEFIPSCVCPEGKVLNDRGDGFQCVSSCPCVFAGQNYSTGGLRKTKCQSCACDGGKWQCSANICPTKCVIEGQFVTTFDGKQYVVPGKCKYVASQGNNWTITVLYSDKSPSLTAVFLKIFQETYTFSLNVVKFGSEEITDLHMSEHAVVFWQSSMYVQVNTVFNMTIQVQMSPEIQLYITSPHHTGNISGLCGNNNGDTTDDFTTSSGIIENAAQPFAQSWSFGVCPVAPPYCTNTDNEIFADEKCSVLNDPTGIFAKCHSHLPTDHYHMACIQRTCSCGSSLSQCLCVALGSYAKACASLGVVIGDWRKATNCTVKCQKNQEFSYTVQACNQTCSSLSGSDIRCLIDYEPVEGCSCPEGTHLDQGHTCTPKGECHCHYYGGITAPGSVVIDGQHCVCENGELRCSPDCGCTNGKVCIHCSNYSLNTAQKTCESSSKPMAASTTCVSGCYCPNDQYEDHLGNCVPISNCTCMYSGKVFSALEIVKTNCKICGCAYGQWSCLNKPCPGKCQVYGNGHYQTFDSKWYRFDGQCQYVLVEDDCGTGNGTFSVRVESVPCCDEALTCSRSIILDLQGHVTLTLSDMKVTRRHQKGWTLQEEPLYSTHTVGLYIVISVPSRGITLIWDKHTRITVELHQDWRNRVCGLCGNFDSNEMNDLQMSGSAVMSSSLAFGNSWKAATPPCSDVTTEKFPCERNSYCSAWAQRRCMILTGDTFRDCHLKVDPGPYYSACVQESCSCEFEGKFLGFCTAVAAYAEACSEWDVCVNWRTPDLCPVYCDYYNEHGQCSWHYEACGEMLTCGHDNYVTHKLEGCYPRCSKEEPFYDENTGACTKLRNCTCYFNDTIIQPGTVVVLQSHYSYIQCRCENGAINCPPPPSTTTSTPTTTTTSVTSTTSVWTTMIHTTAPTTTTTYSTTTETSPTTITSSTTPTTITSSTTPTTITSSTTPTSTSTTPTTTITSTPTTTWSTSTSTTTETSPTTTPTTSITSTTTETSPTTTPTTTITSSTTPTSTSTSSTTPTTTITSSTTPTTTITSSTTPTSTSTTHTTTIISTTTPGPTGCECTDLKRGKSWYCNETWTEDCFHKTCVNETIESNSVLCAEPTIPNCPRGQVTSVSDGCCETPKCNCRCDIYGDPHYISFQGVHFDFMEDCTYVLVEERWPRYHLTIAVDNIDCGLGLSGSCAKGVILKYQNNIATLNVLRGMTQGIVQATLNNMTIKPPYEEDGIRFETTEFIVTIYLPEIRSSVSLSPSHNLVVTLAMEHFLNNTQGQCGVCGVGSCIRKGGPIEKDTCCGETAYGWVYTDPLKPDCASVSDVPCDIPTPPPPTPCPPNVLCELLNHPVFSECSRFVNLELKKKSCEFDSCRIGPCASLEQAAEECMKFGFCIDWRELTNGSCNVTCPEGLVYRECRDRLDDFCYGGIHYPGASLKRSSEGCFCPSGLLRAGNHSNVCVSDCDYCKGPLGEPRMPGEVWRSDCYLCTCNNQTQTEECVPIHIGPPPVCNSTSVLMKAGCCGGQICVEKTCSYNEETYQVGDTWNDAAYPCTSFRCSKEGIQAETRECPREDCREEDRIWDEQHCCFTCKESCAPKVTNISVTIENCTTVVQLPVCSGVCVTEPRVVLDGDLLVKQDTSCCVERSSVRRPVTLECDDLTTREFTYQHIIACECTICNVVL